MVFEFHRHFPREPTADLGLSAAKNMRRWLWDSADELLAALYPPGTERAWTDDQIRQWTERGGSPDLDRYPKAYDQLLWEIVTSPRDELAAFAAVFYQKPYMDLPPPLQVAVWRLLGLECPDDLEQLRAAATGIAMYCCPQEEAGGCQGIKAHMERLATGRTAAPDRGNV